MSLVLLADVRTFIEISSGVADTLLQTLIDDASGRINDYCGRDFESRTYNEEIDIEGCTEDSILLDNVPISSVVALTDNGSLVDTDDYHVYEHGRVSLENSYFTEGYKKVEISYVAGFTPVPASIQNAAKKLVAEDYKGRKLRGFQSESIGDYKYRVPSMEKTQGFPADVLAILNRYKLITGA